MPEYTVVSSISNSYATSYVGGRKIVRDLDDDMHCCWTDSNDVFYSKSADDGATWGTPEMVSDGQTSYNPSICVDSDGNIHIVWHGVVSGESSNRIRYRKRTDSWQTIVEFATFGGHGGHQRYPVIAVDSDDYIHVLWLDYTAKLINYRKYTDSWQPPETAAPGGHRGPSIASDLDGNIHIVYSKETASQPGDYQILYRKNTAGSWSSATELTNVDENQDYACITVDRHNYVHVVWVGRTAVSGYIQVRYKRYTTSWQAIEEVTTGSYHQTGASVSVDGDDNIYVIFDGYTPASPYYNQIQCRRNTGSWQAIEYITAPDPLYPYQCRNYPSAVSSLFPTLGALRPNMPNAGWAGVYTEYRSYGNVFVRYYASSDLEWPGSDDTFVLSKTFLTTREAVKSTVELSEPLLIDRVQSFWFLDSVYSSICDNIPYEVPALNKQQISGQISTLDLAMGGEKQKYHSFRFDEFPGLYNGLLATRKFWAHDQHNAHLALLATQQKAVHIYDLSSGVEDLIYSYQADEFEIAEGITFSDGRVDVLIPTTPAAPSYPYGGGNNYSFDFSQRGIETFIPVLYSFNIDGTPIAGPVEYSKAATAGKVMFYEEAFGLLSECKLKELEALPLMGKTEFEDSAYVDGKTTFVDDVFTKSAVAFADDGWVQTQVVLKPQPPGVWGGAELLFSPDFFQSECLLANQVEAICLSKCSLIELDPDHHLKSKTTFDAPYKYSTASRVTAVGDYLLLGIKTYISKAEDTASAFFLTLFERSTYKLLWCKSLRTTKVEGTTLYDGWLWEDIRPKSNYTQIFSESKVELELFDCFGEPRIGLARYGKLYGAGATHPYIPGVVFEEYDINFENPCSIEVIADVPVAHPTIDPRNYVIPQGMLFKNRDPYDLPLKTGEPKKDYMCCTFRTDYMDSIPGHHVAKDYVRIYQRDEGDTDYIYAGCGEHDRFGWLVALTSETSPKFLKSEVALNIDFGYLGSNAWLHPFYASIVSDVLLSQTSLQESLIKIIQSKTNFEDSWLLSSKVFMDDFLLRSSAEFVDNKEICFMGRFIACPANIIRIDDNLKAYPSFSKNIDAVLRPAIVGRDVYYVRYVSFYNFELWEDEHHYFLVKVNLGTYAETLDLPDVLYHECTGASGPYPDFAYPSGVWVPAYLSELDYTPYAGCSLGYFIHDMCSGQTPLVHLSGVLYYIAETESSYGIASILLDSYMSYFHSVNYILPDYTKLFSIETDGTYLYVLGYKSDIEGIWLIKLNACLSVLNEMVIFKGRLNTVRNDDIDWESCGHFFQSAQFDSINKQFITGAIPVAGRRDETLTGVTHPHGYGPVVYSAEDGSVKWWKNNLPVGALVLHTIPDLDSCYLSKKTDDTIGVYTCHGEYTGFDLDDSEVTLDMISSCVEEVWIENFMQSKTMLVKSIKEQDDNIPDIPGPTQVPREQRFAV